MGMNVPRLPCPGLQSFTGASLPATLAGKPKGPVLENTIGSEVAAPTVKRGFVMPKFRGAVRASMPPWFRAGWAYPQGWPHG